jgi:hypothetical protein
MPDALDPLPLLRHLSDHGVRHIIIGGFAVVAHGHVRPSKDLDIVPEPSRGNLELLVTALAAVNAEDIAIGDFEAPELPMSAMRLEDLEQGGNFRLTTDLGALDIMQWASGIEEDDLYGALDREALEGMVRGVSVRVCGLNHLRAMKRAAGRPQDLEDLDRLDV